MPSESGHWYEKNGRPAYTQEIKTGKNKGQERKTTLRDARKLDLLPSVTTVLNVLDKPGLTNWKIDQAILAALATAMNDGELYKDFVERIKQEAKESSIKARDEGTFLHGVVERYFETGDAGLHGEMIDNVLAELPKNQDWKQEKTCVCLKKGYAGKVDIHSSEWVVDIKTKDGLHKVAIFDEHMAQTAAYKNALSGVRKDARCGILFICRETHEAKFVELSDVQVKRGTDIFDKALDLWKTIKNYDPLEES